MNANLTEAPRPELETPHGFESLFQAPNNELPSNIKTVLAKAPSEIKAIIVAPLVRMETTLTTSADKLHPTVLENFKKQYGVGMEAVAFFDGFCESANGVGKYELRTETDPNGGIDIFMRPWKEGVAWGKIGEDNVDEVQIRIRTGENTQNSKDAYTPMQLNFRFLQYEHGKAEEITSLRVDMHNRENAEIQVDAIVGGDMMDRKHEAVRSMNNGDKEENFRALQAAFLLNFSERFLLSKGEDDKFDIRGGIQVDKSSRPHLETLAKELNKAQNFLDSLKS